MSFIDNPVISSLAGSIGLGGLTQAGSNPLAASATTTPKIAPTHSPQNQPEYREARFFDPRSPQGASGGSTGTGMPLEPGAMSPDVQNNPTVMDLLSHFGVHPQQQIDPNLFIHNAHAWANHPVMSGVLEGLLSGAANTHGSDTLGEGIGNVARGLADTQAQRTQRVNAQLMMPYQQAMTVASLQDQAGKQTLQEAQQKEAISRSNYYDDLLDANQRKVQTQADASVKRASITANGRAASAAAKPQSIDQQTWNAARQAHLSKIVAPGEEPTDEDLAKATQLALQDVGTAKQAPKTAGALAVSHGTVADKQAVKATMSGGSATAGANAPGYVDPTRKAQIAAAEQDLKSFDNNKNYVAGDPSKGEPMVLIKGDPLYNKKRAALVAKRDALVGGSSAPAPTTPQKITHRYNPATKQIEAVPASN